MFVSSVCLSMAAFPAKRTKEVMPYVIENGAHEPLFGELSLDHVQVCPQNFGLIDGSVVDLLKSQSPCTQYRLHANAKVSAVSRPYMGDCSDLANPAQKLHFDSIIEVQRRFGSNPYSIHAGTRDGFSLESLHSEVMKFQDRAGFAVAVEGLYPEKGNKWLISSWEEYAWLMNSGLHYALDLSHLNIVRKRSRRDESNLVLEMLNNENCLEIHVSHNSGTSDSHQVCIDDDIWWVELLKQCSTKAVIFSEGNQLSKDRARQIIGKKA